MADGYHPFPYLHLVAVAEPDMREGLLCRYPHDCKIGLGITAHELGRVLPPVGQGDLYLRGPSRNMMIRKDVATGVDDHPAAESVELSLVFLWRPRVPEKIAKQGVPLEGKRRTGHLLPLHHIDVNHRRDVLFGDLDDGRCKVDSRTLLYGRLAISRQADERRSDDNGG